MTEKKNFTLVELLTVIGIIGILMSILFPVLSGIQERGKITETRAQVNAVRLAICAYQGEYGNVPRVSSDEDNGKPVGHPVWSGNIDNIKPKSEYYEFFDILTYSNHGASDQDPDTRVQKANPSRIHFLSTTKHYFGKNHENSIRDSWGHPLAVFLNKDGTGNFDLPEAYSQSKSDHYVDDATVIVSMGSQKATNFNDIVKNQYIFSCK